ncbi:MAG: hypothetical protein ABEI54_05135 [Candidatus Bipolaricaulia bacterium]
MKLKEKVPFLETQDGEERGQVRLLGKVGNVEDFQLSDFNKLVKSSIKTMEDNRKDESVLLHDDLKEDINREDLLERHLSYRVEVTEGTVTDKESEDNIVEESTTFRVILRAQPNEAIEINGPDEIAHPYKEALRETLIERKGEEVEFQNIVNE